MLLSLSRSDLVEFLGRSVCSFCLLPPTQPSNLSEERKLRLGRLDDPNPPPPAILLANGLWRTDMSFVVASFGTDACVQSTREQCLKKRTRKLNHRGFNCFMPSAPRSFNFPAYGLEFASEHQAKECTKSFRKSVKNSWDKLYSETGHGLREKWRPHLPLAPTFQGRSSHIHHTSCPP